jgi:uncharacterized protein (DUF1330 family)
MSAYVIVDIDVKDKDAYAGYIQMSPTSIAAYGGRFLARGGRTEKLEGEWTPKRLVILEFESLDRAKQWLDSPEYAPAKAIRHRTASTNMVVIEGV